MNRRIARIGRMLLVAAALLYASMLVGLSIVQVLMPARNGWLALTQIFAPYLFFPLLLALPLALHNNAGLLKLALVACAIIFAVRFGSGMVSWPTQPVADASQVEVMTWNVYRYNQQSQQIQQALHTAPAEVISLHELSAKQARAIAKDPLLAQRYPHQVLRPHKHSEIGLLSVYPILAYGKLDQSDTIWARLDLRDNHTLMLVLVHPPSGDITLSRKVSHKLPVPYDFNPEERDHEITQIRALLDSLLQRGEPLIVLGDFNVTEREPAYQQLTDGLQDAHYQVGLGPGNTWRPSRHLPFGLLRIDYLLSGPGVVPLRTDVDCTPRGSDHCIVHGTFEVR